MSTSIDGFPLNLNVPVAVLNSGLMLTGVTFIAGVIGVTLRGVSVSSGDAHDQSVSASSEGMRSVFINIVITGIVLRLVVTGVALRVVITGVVLRVIIVLPFRRSGRPCLM